VYAKQLGIVLQDFGAQTKFSTSTSGKVFTGIAGGQEGREAAGGGSPEVGERGGENREDGGSAGDYAGQVGSGVKGWGEMEGGRCLEGAQETGAQEADIFEREPSGGMRRGSGCGAASAVAAVGDEGGGGVRVEGSGRGAPQLSSGTDASGDSGEEEYKEDEFEEEREEEEDGKEVEQA